MTSASSRNGGDIPADGWMLVVVRAVLVSFLSRMDGRVPLAALLLCCAYDLGVESESANGEFWILRLSLASGQFIQCQSVCVSVYLVCFPVLPTWLMSGQFRSV